jgi:hypothetical protein
MTGSSVTGVKVWWQMPAWAKQPSVEKRQVLWIDLNLKVGRSTCRPHVRLLSGKSLTCSAKAAFQVYSQLSQEKVDSIFGQA